MTSELERLKTTCLAQEAEIARLQAGFDELNENIESSLQIEDHTVFDAGWSASNRRILNMINRITGVKE